MVRVHRKFSKNKYKKIYQRMKNQCRHKAFYAHVRKFPTYTPYWPSCRRQRTVCTCRVMQVGQSGIKVGMTVKLRTWNVVSLINILRHIKTLRMFSGGTLSIHSLEKQNRKRIAKMNNQEWLK